MQARENIPAICRLKMSKNLKAVDFFDVYFDETITNTVNLGLRLEFQSSDRTLNALEIDDLK